MLGSQPAPVARPDTGHFQIAVFYRLASLINIALYYTLYGWLKDNIQVGG